MNAHQTTFGTSILHGTAGATAATELLIDKITQLPRKTPEKINISRINQASKQKQYVFGMHDVEDLVFLIGHDPTVVAGLIASQGTQKSWRVRFGPSVGHKGTLDFDGEHTVSLASAEEGDEVLWEVRVTPTTAQVFTAPA